MNPQIQYIRYGVPVSMNDLKRIIQQDFEDGAKPLSSKFYTETPVRNVDYGQPAQEVKIFFDLSPEADTTETWDKIADVIRRHINNTPSLIDLSNKMKHLAQSQLTLPRGIIHNTWMAHSDCYGYELMWAVVEHDNDINKIRFCPERQYWVNDMTSTKVDV